MNGHFNLIRGSRDIAKFLGYNEAHLRTCILPEMAELGCAFKLNNKRSSPWLTTPFFINLFLFLRNANKKEEETPTPPIPPTTIKNEKIIEYSDKPCPVCTKFKVPKGKVYCNKRCRDRRSIVARDMTLTPTISDI